MVYFHRGNVPEEADRERRFRAGSRPVADPTLVDTAAGEPPDRISRDMGVALTVAGEKKAESNAFVASLASLESQAICVKWSWTPASQS